MDYFVHKINAAFTAEFASLGFKRYRNSRMRMVNDIAQGFFYERFNTRYAPWVRLCFYIEPLCCRIHMSDVFTYMQFCTIDSNKRSKRYEYEKNSKKDIDRVVDEIITDIKEQIVPVYERATDCKGALAEICEINLSRARGNGAYYPIALKIGDYELALDFLLKMVGPPIEEVRETYRLRTTLEMTPELIQRRIDTRNEIIALAEMVKNRDTEAVEKMLRENEEFSLKNLREMKLIK
ncbi:MAG: hypothetical protein LBO63_00245 [Oscillospiraceae bacterium]|jgi:hypothetical protein|nr:hypothetical protein [Oscillospiraceae bacterium]